MLRTTFAVGSVALGMSVASTGFAQSADEEGAVRYREVQVEQARTDMESARRQLEEAARTIAVQARVLPDSENSYAMLSNFYGFGGQGRIGATIVDADDGALVTALRPDGGAEEAGIRVGDVIRSIDGVDVTGADEDPSEMVMGRLQDIEPGSTVAIVVERGGQSLAFDVETAEGPGWLGGFAGPMRTDVQVFDAPDAPGSPRFVLENIPQVAPGLEIVRTLGFASSPWADMELVSLSEGLGRYFDTSEGLLVIRGPEDEAIDIQDGDVILSINGRTPNSPEHAIRILVSFEAGETIEFSIMRDGRRRSIEYSIPDAADRRPRVPAVPVTD
ncbi:MAG: PDZ domain-containing protein [Gammaproteobacteria bacterium]|jgi:S1-C subfamily serine protease